MLLKVIALLFCGNEAHLFDQKLQPPTFLRTSSLCTALQHHILQQTEKTLRLQSSEDAVSKEPQVRPSAAQHERAP